LNCIWQAGNASPPQTTKNAQERTMKNTAVTLALSGLLAFTAVGCAVTRDQSTVGEYVDDTTVTTRVKAKLAENPTVSAMSISVETLKGTVQLSGFAKSAAERNMAGDLARNTSGVKAVKNDIVIRP
jgi:osmotically-inducible protein OsmY